MRSSCSSRSPRPDDYALVWNGSSWGSPILLGTATSQETTDSFVAYESTSGQAIVVYDSISGGKDMNYRTWDGANWRRPADGVCARRHFGRPTGGHARLESGQRHDRDGRRDIVE